MKLRNFFATVTLSFMALGMSAQSEDDKKIMTDADTAKTEILTAEYGLDKFVTDSKGYVIFPNVGEGALILGGASGNGVLYENGVPVGMADLKKIDIGLQAGGQTFTEIIFFETEEALDNFKEGNFELSAEASAVALEKGKTYKVNYNDGVMIFTKPKKGLMADISIGGQKFDFESMAASVED